eukprot:17037-Heterococcus_DN1.PRE.2
MLKNAVALARARAVKKPLGNDGCSCLCAHTLQPWHSLAHHADNSTEAALSFQPLSIEACTSFT